MCGEIDENISINQELLERFGVMSKMIGVTLSKAPETGPNGLSTSEGRATYMGQIFRAGLTRALSDALFVEDDEAVDAMASQAIAFARLAGFLAAQLPPDADLFRSVIEAVTAGHSEPAQLERKYRDDQDKAHGHSHDDGEHHH